MPVSEWTNDSAGIERKNNMLNKHNIVEIINDHQKEIDEIRAELKIVHTPYARRELENRISCLDDNMYRYKLQAKAWGIDV